MKKISNSVSRYVAAVMAAYAMCVPSYGTEANALIDEAKSSLSSSASSFVDLILVIFGLVGIIFIVINAVKYFKGDHDSENSMFKVGIGIILGVIIIYVIKDVMIKA